MSAETASEHRRDRLKLVDAKAETAQPAEPTARDAQAKSAPPEAAEAKAKRFFAPCPCATQDVKRGFLGNLYGRLPRQPARQNPVGGAISSWKFNLIAVSHP